MQGINEKVCAAIFAVVIVLLTACGGHGGGSSNGSGAATPAGGIHLQVVSFGDSLSDVGTYAPIASAVGSGAHLHSGSDGKQSGGLTCYAICWCM
jgi:hypothetical protein